MSAVHFPGSQEWFARACAVLPGGVNSPVRAFGSVGGAPFFVAAAKGVHLQTVDGTELLDWVGSWGPMLLGHSHPAVSQAIVTALESGASFGACSRPEVQLAEEIVARVPGLEKVRLVNSGTEATMSALRLARAATQRDAFIKFRGCYHGHSDAFLVAAGSGALTFGHPSSPGVTESVSKDTLIAEFNDLASVEACFAARPDGIAAIILEAVPGNMGLVPPAAGFLEGLRALCDQHGTLLIVDEVMTGFRLARGGALERFGLRADLVTLGKVAGGGLPLAAFGGSAKLMDLMSPVGPVYQAGTLSGNPLACAAGLALLQLLEPPVYERLESLGKRLEKQLVSALEGLPVCCQRVGSMATVFFHPGPLHTFADVDQCDRAAYGRFFQEMLRRGHFLPPAQFEAFFISAAHSHADIDRLAHDIGESARIALG